MHPPLRTAADAQAIKDGLADGTIDVIATDHAPHAGYEKEVEFTEAPFGILGLETCWGLTVRDLVRPGVLTLAQAVAKLAVAPREILGLDVPAIAGGRRRQPDDLRRLDGVDLRGRSTSTPKSNNTPFVGAPMVGRAWAIVNNGQLVEARGVIGVCRGDITTLDVDAVVNAANRPAAAGRRRRGRRHPPRGGPRAPGGRAAQFPSVRRGVRCPTGEARITPGFRLPARWVIHTVGPVWRGGGEGEDEALARAYRSSLARPPRSAPSRSPSPRSRPASTASRPTAPPGSPSTPSASGRPTHEPPARVLVGRPSTRPVPDETLRAATLRLGGQPPATTVPILTASADAPDPHGPLRT